MRRAFETESELQELIHLRPDIVQSGIPEVDPALCATQSKLVSLGREIRLPSGPLDNLYIDTDGIFTLIECKRYSDERLKRDVYAQAMNYAADLKSVLASCSGDAFVTTLETLVTGDSPDRAFASWSALLDALEQDPLLEGKSLQDWRRDFVERLQQNVRRGVFRIVILCGSAPGRAFAKNSVSNLMRLMQYSETGAGEYDLILMDVRWRGEDYEAKMIWRSYAEMPSLPLVSAARRTAEERLRSAQSCVADLSHSLGLPADAFWRELVSIHEGARLEDWTTRREEVAEGQLKVPPLGGEDNSGFKWGRLGLNLWTPWVPSVFVGLYLSDCDHREQVLNADRGGDFAIILDVGGKRMNFDRDGFFGDPEYASLCARLEGQSEWVFTDHLQREQRNRWHPLYLRRAAHTVFEGARSREERRKRWYEAAESGLELLLRGGELRRLRGRYQTSTPQ